MPPPDPMLDLLLVDSVARPAHQAAADERADD
jgi:hypothetical protein